MGFFSAFGRLGGMIAPFVAVDLPANGLMSLAFLIITGSLGLAAASSLALQVETVGRALHDAKDEALSHQDIQRSNDQSFKQLTDADQDFL